MKKLIFALAFVCYQAYAPAQTTPIIKNLVFEGAGIRGVAYAGVISELESRNMLQGVEKVGGTSAGAIVALALSLGYTANEIQKAVTEINFKKFNDGNFFFPGGIHRTNKYFGWYRGNRFERWLGQLIDQKTGNANITFEELRAKGFKDLYVTGTCLNRQQLVIFSSETYPKMRVKDAVRISASIPLYFEAVFMDKDGNVIKHPRQKEGLDIMVDGGFTGNFPIRMFDAPAENNSSTLGFRIDSDEQIKNDRDQKTIAALPVGNFKQYMAAFYNIIIENLNRQQLTEKDWKRTVSVSDGKVGPRIRKLRPTEIQVLVNNGKQAVANYITSR